MSVTKRTVGILMFDGVEVLDFAGPFEVFSRARLVPGTDSRRSDESAPFSVCLISADGGPVSATGNLRVMVDFSLSTAPHLDIFIVPGGFGTRPLLDDAALVAAVAARARQAEIAASVCTGALLLAKGGLLEGRKATTHWGALDLLASLGSIDVLPDRRYVEDGVLTSAGVAAGIDLSLAIVERLCGRAVADDTARYMDYPRS